MARHDHLSECCQGSGHIALANGQRFVVDPDEHLDIMEAQGNIPSDFFALKFRSAPHALYEAKYRNSPDARVLHESVVHDFLANPKSPAHLHRQVTIVQPIRRMVSKKALILLAFVICTGLSSTSHATSIRYDAQVLDRGGQPCFTVDKTHFADAPRLASIEVIAESGQSEIAWREFTVAGKGDPVIFFDAVCLHYGTKLENGGAFAAAQKLTAGRHYAVMLNTDVTRRGKLENRRYRAYFCLVQRNDSSQRVQQVFYDEAVHRWDWAACGEVG